VIPLPTSWLNGRPTWRVRRPFTHRARLGTGNALAGCRRRSTSRKPPVVAHPAGGRRVGGGPNVGWARHERDARVGPHASPISAREMLLKWIRTVREGGFRFASRRGSGCRSTGTKRGRRAAAVVAYVCDGAALFETNGTANPGVTVTERRSAGHRSR
jgi:hypothetical protein